MDPSLVRAGDVWDLTFDDTTVHIAATKGMDDLAALLAAPGRDVHCVDLVGGAVEQPTTGAVIDATARRQYEARIRELQADIDEADRHHDVGRADRCRASSTRSSITSPRRWAWAARRARRVPAPTAPARP